MDGILSVLKMILMLIVVILIAQIALRYMNKYTTKKNKVIKIIEKIPVNNNSYLSIVDIGGSYYLMSFTSKDNKILKELESKEVADLIWEMETNDPFTDNYPAKLRQRIGKNKDKKSLSWNEEEN